MASSRYWSARGICTPRVPASSHQVVGNWARVKTWHANLMQKGAWPLHLKKQEVAGKARKTKRVSEADWVSAAGS